MIRDGDVLVTALASGLDHFLRRVLSIAPAGMHVKVALDIGKLDDVGKLARGGSLDFSLVFAQDRRNKRQTEFFEDVLLFGAGDVFVGGVKQSVFVQLQAKLDGSLAHADVVSLRS